MRYDGGMEREQVRAWRAARSYAYNLRLQERVQDRLERARVALQSYLLLQGETESQLGAYRIELEEGALTVTHRASDADGWEQLDLEALLEVPEPRGMGR